MLPYDSNRLNAEMKQLFWLCKGQATKRNPINSENHQHVMMMFITDAENNNAIILQYIGITVSTFSLQLPSTIIKILLHTSVGLESAQRF